MIQTLTPIGFKEGWGETGSECRVAYFYQDAVTCKPLLQLDRMLSRKFDTEIEFDATWWRFKFLQDDLILSLAAHTAAKADLIVFATYAHLEVAPELQMLNKIWLKQRAGRPNGLLSLLQCHEGQSGGATPMHLYLKEVASLAQMDFLSRWVLIGEDAPDTPAITVDDLRLPGVVAGLAEAIGPGPAADPPLRPPVHWGLNE